MAIQEDPEGTETEVLHSLVDFTGKNVLEVGCGDGRLTWRFADSAQKVTAIDPDSGEIAAAIENRRKELDSKVDFIESALLDFNPTGKSSKFDVIILSWSLCCMRPQDMVLALERTYELLETDGLLINIHPYGERDLEIHSGNKLWRAGRVRDITDYEDERQARAALDKVLENALYIAERECTFPFLTHFGTMSELEEWIAEDWQKTNRLEKALKQGRKLEKQVGAEGDVVLRRKLFIASLRPNENYISHP